MNRTRQIRSVGIALGIGALAAACGREPVVPATETTSAPMTTTSEAEQSKIEIARLERERNEARQRVADELQRNEEQAKKLAAEVEAKRDRADLAQLASSKVEAAEAELKALEKKAARAPAKTRLKMEKSMGEIRDKLANAQAQARQIGMDHGAAWSSFKTGVETAISDLDRAVRSANAP